MQNMHYMKMHNHKQHERKQVVKVVWHKAMDPQRCLAPTWVHNTNGIWIGSVIFAGLTIVTDRPTDQQTTILSL